VELIDAISIMNECLEAVRDFMAAMERDAPSEELASILEPKNAATKHIMQQLFDARESLKMVIWDDGTPLTGPILYPPTLDLIRDELVSQGFEDEAAAIDNALDEFEWWRLARARPAEQPRRTPPALG
jgi:hypothetical protein